MLRLVSACLLLCTLSACSFRVPSVHCPDIAKVQPYVTLIKDFATIFSALAAACIAYQGLQAWKKQLRGKTDYHLARKLLRNVYEVRDAVKVARSPFIIGTEAESEEVAYQRRWQALRKAFAKLDVNALEAQALWGDVIPKLVQSLREHVGELYVSITRYLYERGKVPVHMSREEVFRLRQVVFQTEEGDEYAARMDRIIGEFEKDLKPKLRLQ